MKNLVNVRIFNRPYNLSTDDQESYIKKISSIVDEKIRGAISAAPGMNVIDAAILTALEAVDEKQKALSTIDDLRSQIKDYVDDAGEARLKCDEAQKELRALKAKYADLEKEVEIRRMFNKKDETEEAVKKAEEAAAKASAAKAAAEKAAAELKAAKAAEESRAKSAGVRRTETSTGRPPITSSSRITSSSALAAETPSSGSSQTGGDTPGSSPRSPFKR